MNYIIFLTEIYSRIEIYNRIEIYISKKEYYLDLNRVSFIIGELYYKKPFILIVLVFVYKDF